jgi:hypothetical protein
MRSVCISTQAAVPLFPIIPACERTRTLGCLLCRTHTKHLSPRRIPVRIAAPTDVMALCVRVFYYGGQVGEYCEPCPVGGVCDGGYAEPRSAPGFYIGNMSDPLNTRSDVCPGRHSDRAR